MDQSEQGSLIGEYSVMIVPPNDDGGTWLVTLGQWEPDQESFVASSDGPLLASREDALAEAGDIMDWLTHQAGSDNLVRVWKQMQEQRGAEQGLNERFLTSRNPWNI